MAPSSRTRRKTGSKLTKHRKYSRNRKKNYTRNRKKNYTRNRKKNDTRNRKKNDTKNRKKRKYKRTMIGGWNKSWSNKLSGDRRTRQTVGSYITSNTYHQWLCWIVRVQGSDKFKYNWPNNRPILTDYSLRADLGQDIGNHVNPVNPDNFDPKKHYILQGLREIARTATGENTPYMGETWLSFPLTNINDGEDSSYNIKHHYRFLPKSLSSLTCIFCKNYNDYIHFKFSETDLDKTTDLDVIHGGGIPLADGGFMTGLATVGTAFTYPAYKYSSPSIFSDIPLRTTWNVIGAQLETIMTMKPDHTSTKKAAILFGHHHSFLKLLPLDKGQFSGETKNGIKNNGIVILKLHSDTGSGRRWVQLVKVINYDPVVFRSVEKKKYEYLDRDDTVSWKSAEGREATMPIVKLMLLCDLKYLILYRHGMAIHNLLKAGDKFKYRQFIRNSRLLPVDMIINGVIHEQSKKLHDYFQQENIVQQDITWCCSDLVRAQQTLVTCRWGYENTVEPEATITEKYNEARKDCIEHSYNADQNKTNQWGFGGLNTFRELYKKLITGETPEALNLTTQFMKLYENGFNGHWIQMENNIWASPEMSAVLDNGQIQLNEKQYTQTTLKSLQHDTRIEFDTVDAGNSAFTQFKQALKGIQENWKTDDTGLRDINWDVTETYPGDKDSKNFYKLFEDDLLSSLLTNHIQTYEKLSNGTDPSKHAYYQTLSLLSTDKVILIGDIHSSLYNLLKIIEDLINQTILTHDWKFNTGTNYYLVFLGDIIDRGGYSLECLIIVLMLKLLNPERVLILAGNHETKATASSNGLSFEINIETGSHSNGVVVGAAPHFLRQIWTLFSYLPIVAFARYESDTKMYQLCHGGIDGNFLHVSEVLNLSGEIPDGLSKLFTFPPSPSYGYLLGGANGFQWSDFTQSGTNVRATQRGGAVGPGLGTYPPPPTDKYLTGNIFHCIISGHQDSTNVLVQVKNTQELPNYHRSIYGFGLFTPDNIEDMHPLDPTDDNILSIITSTAYGPKSSEELTMSCYLELSNNLKGEQRIHVHAIPNTPFAD